MILLRYYENLPPRAVAETLGAPLETVKTRLHRGLEQLRGRLDAAHGESEENWRLAIAPLAGLHLSTTSGGAAAGSGAALAGALSLWAKVKIAATAALIVGGTITLWTLVGQNESGADLDFAGADSGSIAVAQRGGDGAAGGQADAAPHLAGMVARQRLVPTEQVSGRVLDARCRRSVVGATVILSKKDDKEQVVKTTTDRSGRFAIGGIDDPGPAWLAIRAPGYGNRVIDVGEAGGSVAVFDELLLEPRWCVQGRVVDGDDRPVAGARITGLFKSRFEKVDGKRELVREELFATSGEDGSFIFCAGNDRSERYGSGPGLYRAEAEGSASLWTATGDGEIVLLRLEPARKLTGRVLWSQDGSPIAGATVRCRDERDYNLQKHNATHVGHDGAFRFARVPDREVEVNVFVQSPTDARKPPECRVTAPGGLGNLGTLIVDGPASLDVWVRDEKKEQAIEGAIIGYGDSGYTMGSIGTDSGGLARITGLPAETRIFLFCSLEWESKSQNYMRRKRSPTRIINSGEPGSVTTVHLSLSTEPFWEDEPDPPPKTPVAGIVKDPDNNPIAGARVEFFIDGSPEPPDPDPIKRNRKLYLGNDFREGSHPNHPVDQSGRFAFEILCVPGIHTIRNVTVTHPHHVPVWMPGAAFDGRAMDDLAFTLEPVTEWLDGVVCAVGGERLPRCNVRAVYTVAEEGNEKVEFAYHPATDDEGRFHVPYVPDMILACGAAPKGCEGNRVRGESNRFRQTASPAIRMVVKKHAPPPVEPPPERYPVSVRCVSSDGRPMSQVEITAWAREGESLWRGIGTYRGWFKDFTDRDGRASMESDRSGSILIRSALFKKSQLTSRDVLLFEEAVNAQTGSGEKLVTLPAGQVIEILIVYHGISDAVAECIGLLPTRSMVALVPDDGRPAISLLDEELEEEGRYWFTRHEEMRYGGHRALALRRLVPKGAYRIRVKIPGYVPHHSPLLTLLDSDEILSLVVDLELDE